jgi:hypothetical protein
VTSTLATLLALSGTAWAATTVTGANVENGTLTGADFKAGSLTGADLRSHSVAEAKLTAADHVPHLIRTINVGTVSHDATSSIPTTGIPHGSFVQPAGTTLWILATGQTSAACPPDTSFEGSVNIMDGNDMLVDLAGTKVLGPASGIPVVLSPPSHSVTHTLQMRTFACSKVTPPSTFTYYGWTESHVQLQIYAT